MPRPRRLWFLDRWILIAALCTVSPLLAQIAVAQVAPVPGGPAAPAADDQSSHDDKATPPGVSVPDSPGALERLNKAREKENQKQWKTAAEYYNEALNKYSNRVVPVRRDPDKAIYQYEGIAPAVQERISKWPEEGLKVYRSLYGQTASDMLSAAPRGDIAALRAIFWNYFVTDAGKTAALRLMDTAMESGDFHAAAWLGDRLLTLHPSLAGDRSMVMYRTALAYFWAGDEESSHRLQALLKQTAPADIGTIAGKDTVLTVALDQILSAPAIKPTTRPWDADTYPSFGGLGERGDISSSTAKPGASLNSIVLAAPDANGLMRNIRTQFNNSDQNSLLSGAAMGIMPVVDNGALFFQDGRNLYAVDADSGSPLPGWLATYGGERQGRYKLSALGRARKELLTVTVTPSSVLAIMGQIDPLPQMNNNFGGGFVVQNVGQASTVKLICLDRETGRENWTRTPSELPDSIAVLHTAEYVGTPLVIPADQAGRNLEAPAASLTPAPGGVGPASKSQAMASDQNEDSVLVVARGGKENQFDDCYVVSLSLKTGQYRWSTYVGSASRNFELDGSNSAQPSQMAIADGRVFVMTNLGTVAALDPSDGRIIWLNSYVRDVSENPEVMFARGRRINPQMQANNITPGKAWAHNPVFVNGGYVFVLPNDAKDLLIYNEASGSLEHRLPMSSFNNSDILLGISDGAVCLTSDTDLYVVDWKKYSPDRGIERCIRWERLKFTDAQESGDNIVYGRGFITADSIFIPSRQRIYQMSMKRQGILHEYPARGVFTGNQGPGNLLVTSHNVIVAGQTRVDVYTDLSLVRQRFEAAMAAAPTDPSPRMDYAEALFAGGQTHEALDRVDEAMNLIGGRDSLRNGKDRSMIFQRLMDFARRTSNSMDKKETADSIALGNGFFERAGAAADSPAERASCRLERAKFDHQLNDYANEVKLCQEILSDDAMRNAVLENDVPASTSAELAIDVATSMDHSTYHEIEQRAQDALKTARSAGDPQQLLAVATTYPNSKAAIEARQEAVNRFEAANQPDKAIDVLRRVYSSTSDTADRANLLVAIANDYLMMPDGVGPALDRLCRAARITPSQKMTGKIRMPDGSTLADLTYSQAIIKLRQMQADHDAASLPDFHLALPKVHLNSPFMPGQQLVIANVTSVVHPLADYSRNDQILTWSAAGLAIYPVGQSAPLATIAAVDKPPLAAACVRSNWLVWTPTQVHHISGEGKLLWTFSAANLSTLVVSSGGDATINEAGENGVDENAQVNAGGGFVRVNGQIIQVPPGGNINIARLRRAGMVVPQPPVPVVVVHTDAEAIVAVQPGGPHGDRIVVSTSIGRILALDGHTGQVVWQLRPADHAVDQLLANAHFTVARMDDPGGSQIAVLDTATGRVIGRRIYGPDNSPRQLVNVALSEESTLAVTLFNTVMVKDLYDAWKPAFTELGAHANADAAPFVGLNQPDQLLIRGGRLVCLYDSSSYVRGYDLARNADPTNPLATRSDSNATSLRMVGSRLFVVTSNRMLQYNLSDPAFYPGGSGSGDHYEQDPGIVSFPPKVRGLLLGKDYAVVINDSVDRGPLGSPMSVLVAFRRALVPGKTRERGDADWDPAVRSDVGVTDWLCSDGAIYYLTKDSNLHVLRGAREGA